MPTGFSSETLRERENLEELVIIERIILKCILNGRAHNGHIWFRIRDGHL